ncbi:Replication initiator protein A (RepA) N-terminus [Lachnospiraceae bacterium C10]|nr:Replication initiator protein A (RepA) N-terminus [Lachnospiraceae bacterium C10]
MDFAYFHEEESEQFAFYRIPQVLFKDEKFAKLSTDAKVLYGLFLNRVSLSKKNHWIDDEGRVYVYYTLVSIQEDLHCASQKALKLLKELESYGLIERVKQGLCKPDRIYVKNFILLQESPVRSGENHHTGVVKITSPECRESPPNNNELNNTECSNTNPFLSGEGMGTDTRAMYRDYLIDTLEIEILKQRNPYCQDRIDEILEIMVDTLCSNRKEIRIAGDDKPAQIVKSQLMKLDSDHIEFVLQCMKENTTQIKNVKQYILAALYNAPLTINNYYSSLVQHDMATGKI